MLSRGSSLLPPMISIFLPMRSSRESSLIAHAATSLTDATLALPPDMWGPMMLTPQEARVSRLRDTAGFSIIMPCMAGAMAMGMPPPRATVAMVVTGVSSMPLAILETVLAVAG